VIGGLLLASTVVNFIDRQTLSVLAPILKQDTAGPTPNSQILIAFRVAIRYAAGIGGACSTESVRRVAGVERRLLHRSRQLTATAQALAGFRVFRFLLGGGEAPTGRCDQAVSEWFPARERASGRGLVAVAPQSWRGSPVLVLFLYRAFGSWRPGSFLRRCWGYCGSSRWGAVPSPETHPRISPEELEYIRKGRAGSSRADPPSRCESGATAAVPEAWASCWAFSLLDPYWFLMSNGFALFLVSKGFGLSRAPRLLRPFLAADLGNVLREGRSPVTGLCRGAVGTIAADRGCYWFGPSMLAADPGPLSSRIMSRDLSVLRG